MQTVTSDGTEHQLMVSAAAQKMRSTVPNAQITELSLDTWRGTTVWEGDLRGSDGVQHTVKSDAAQGNVLLQ